MLVGGRHEFLATHWPKRYRLPSNTIDRVLLEASQHGPEEALRPGLIDEMVSDACDSGRDLIRHLASHSPQAYRVAKRQLRSGRLDVNAAEVAHHGELVAAPYTASFTMRR